MNAAQLVTAMKGRSGRCACPAHLGKSDESLAINDGENGRLLVKCFAGCSYEQITAALAQLGRWSNEARASWQPRRRLQTRSDGEEDARRAKIERARRLLDRSGAIEGTGVEK